MNKNYVGSLAVFIAAQFCSTPLLASKSHYGERFCDYETITCYNVKRGDSWYSLFPDPTRRDLIQRFNRMNVRLRPGMKLAVPNELHSLSVMDISPFKPQITNSGEKLIVVNLDVLAWGAYNEQGNLVHWGPLSGGKDWCPDVKRPCRTVTGTYSIKRKLGSSCKSSKYPLGKGGAPMPYCMFFFRGFALHGSPYVPGYNASHGCVRLFPEDARWINQEFVDPPSSPFGGTTIIVERS
ncbi:L,D-transpeptidase [Zooshikella sp. RANM57]|uniref:L,D-transpeptidase n=1 Tax=Zooshikella sp. RANM57 TaxID=3425863 RepID=UPI003D6FBF81